MINTILLQKLATNSSYPDNEQPRQTVSYMSPEGILAGGATAGAGIYGASKLFDHMKKNYPTSHDAGLANAIAESLKSPKLEKLDKGGAGAALGSAALGGFLGTLRSTDPETQKRYDRVGKTVAGIGTLAGLARAANNAHTAYQGSKMMGAADTRPFLGKYNKLPVDLAIAALPAATYFGARYLPGKIGKLFSKQPSEQQEKTRDMKE